MPSTARALNPSDPPALGGAPKYTRLGRNIHHLSEVESTNDLALAAAQSGAQQGVWVADAQTAGRGRGGHTWHSAPGDGLYVTALLTPRLPASTLQLSLAAGLAAWEAIRETAGITADIRWPNDLVTRPRPGEPHPADPHPSNFAPDRLPPSRKLGGILVETAVEGPTHSNPAMLRYAVIGTGINVAHTSFPPELAEHATSLRLEGWKFPDRQPLLIALLRHLDLYVHALEESYAGLATGLFAAPGILSRLAEASTWLRGKRVHVPEDGGYTGTTAGLDPQGFLLVDDDAGPQHSVRSGGVREL